jgi:hypothetical protein
MKKMLLLSMAAVVSSAAYADVYTYDFGTIILPPPGDTHAAFDVNFTMNIPEPVRGYYMTGNWTDTGSGSHRSNQWFTNLRGSDNVFTVNLSHGGLSTSAPFTFIQTGPYWDNARGASTGPGIANVVAGGTNAGHDRRFFNVPMNGDMMMRFDTSGASAGQSQIENLMGVFLTDAVAPMTGTLTSTSPLFQRPTFLDELHTSGSVFGYATSDFSLVHAGTYLVGAHTRNAETSANFDGMVLLYEGAFDPANPLQNLRGLDQLGLNIATPSMLLDLAPGSYTMVYTTIATGAPEFDVAFTGYVAGVPEPGTMAALGVGALALLRRRRNKK